MTIKDLITRRDKRMPAKTDHNDPFSDFHREMNRLFDDFFTDFSVAPSWGAMAEHRSAFDPKVNVSETDKMVKISAELPGLEKDDVSVELEDNTLVISGEKKEEKEEKAFTDMSEYEENAEKEEKDETWHRVEHSYGSFHRVIPLPHGVDIDNAKADFKKGLLKVSLPKLKTDTESRKKIDISAG